MEVKQNNKVILSVEVNERSYEMHCPVDTPLGELHDVLLQLKGLVVNRITEAQQEEQEVTDKVNKKEETSEIEVPEEKQYACCKI